MALREFDIRWIVIFCALFLGFTYILWFSSGSLEVTNATLLPPNYINLTNNTTYNISINTSNTNTSLVDAQNNLMNSTTSEEEEEEVIGDALFGRAGLRGFIKKRGMVPPFYFTSYAQPARQMAFERWITAYVHGNLVSHAPTPFPHCQVYINHHYKFIWIKGHKVASTAMRTPLGSLCGDRWKVGPNVSYEYCSEPLFRDKKVTVAQIRQWWKEYFVFGIVRNPYTRFASAEEYVNGMLGPSCTKTPQFSDTCREPFIDVRYCKVKRCCWEGSVTHHYRHFMDQSTCLFTDSLLPAVDYIGETETLASDFEEIIQEINNRRDPELPELVNDLVKKNVHRGTRGKLKKRRRLQEEYSYAYKLFQQHQVCLLTIYKFYHKDFMLLEYDPVTSLPKI